MRVPGALALRPRERAGSRCAEASPGPIPLSLTMRRRVQMLQELGPGQAMKTGTRRRAMTLPRQRSRNERYLIVRSQYLPTITGDMDL